MSFINRKNLFIAIITFIVGTFAVASFFGLSLIKRESTVTGKITNILLDREGRANGMTLDSGTQINFSPETGNAIFAAAKIGDDVSATGNAGTKSDYGQAFHAGQLTVNGQTFTEIRERKGPKGEKPRGPKDGDKPRPPKGPRSERRSPDSEMPLKSDDAKPEDAPVPPKPVGEAVSANGTIQMFLVNMKGDVDGLILASGEQIRFSPKVGEQIILAKTEVDSQIAVEGSGVKNELGTILQVNKMTIGNQTFTIND